ncbi:thioredoxin family protein [Reichenbachiella ulvae]|uniref:Thioredoxin fold domain-containing protein n=1 Tax=Reichenbachiella ulvae TaxID=2980104 RepID=A0ABT3CV99_9BACT|nr:thioredoxin fold domain-containing protein [Reichenbachiella ulvae]MCV9387625.1 thioredoxin fold domain-containing protein [Reichenbachiella ulvae]
MKKVLMSLTLLLGLTWATQAQEMNWYTLEEAQKLNTSDSRPIFIDFTAEWCGWCKKMDRTTFSDKEVAERMNKEFYAVKLDFDSPQRFVFGDKAITAKELAQQVAIEGLPTMVVFSSDLQSHQKIVGYLKSNDFMNSLDELN